MGKILYISLVIFNGTEVRHDFPLKRKYAEMDTGIFSSAVFTPINARLKRQQWPLAPIIAHSLHAHLMRQRIDLGLARMRAHR